MTSNCENTNCDMTRREALQVMVTGGMVLVSFFLTGAEAKADAQWVKAGTVDQFALGVPKKVTLPGKQAVFITHQEKDKWLAVSAVCTHKGWELDWNADKKRYVCPKHGATFNINGGDPTAPAPLPLATASVKVLNKKEIQVDAEKLPIGKPFKKPADPAPTPPPPTPEPPK